MAIRPPARATIDGARSEPIPEDKTRHHAIQALCLWQFVTGALPPVFDCLYISNIDQAINVMASDVPL